MPSADTLPPASPIRNVIIAAAFALACAGAAAEGPRWVPVLKCIPVGGSRADFHYCIFFGDEESDRIDEDAGRARCRKSLLLLHPVEDVASRMAFRATRRWYAILTNAGNSCTRDLYDDSIWRSVPIAARHVLVALGADDPDLILISCQFLSGSMSVYYHPRFNRDRAFYEERLRVLRDYLATHDLWEDLPTDRAADGYRDCAHAGPAAAPRVTSAAPPMHPTRQG
jgi:hypothetical protein